jgi:nucleotide-binding universal stress UspA family protein
MKTTIADGPVIAAIDGSDVSSSVIQTAVRMASTLGRRVQVIYVEDWLGDKAGLAAHADLTKTDVSGSRSNDELLFELVATALADAVKQDPDLASVVVERGLYSGLPTLEILQRAKDTSASALVLGRRGLGGFESLLVGSVSDRVVTYADCPVVVVDQDPLPPTGAIVVGVEGSPASEVAAMWAAEFASRAGSTLRAVVAWHEPTLSRWGAGLTAEDLAEMYGADAQRVAAAAIERCRQEYPDLSIDVIVERGPASEVLTAAARQTDVQLLIVGSRGHGSIASTFLGSTARKCLAISTDVPVAVIH